MKQVQTGAQSTKWKQYKEQYGLQAAQIVEGFTQYAETPGILGPNSVKRPTRTSNPILSDDTTEAPTPTIVRQVSGMLEGKDAPTWPTIIIWQPWPPLAIPLHSGNPWPSLP